MSAYFQNIKQAFSSMTEGLKLTFRYLADARKSRTPIGVADETYFEQDKGIVTLEYPYESLPVPDNARYRLHNEIDDCIVCDKCAKVCPVDCIDIDAIRAPESFGETSDGTPKRIHAAKFDIDMSKCCFCGLCTTVCPTECLTMTKVYDFSEFDVEDHVYSFANMSLTEIAQKRQELEAYEAEKAAKKAAATAAKPAAKPAVRPKPVGGKPAVKPALKPKPAGSASAGDTKPAMKPKPAKPKISGKSGGDAASTPKPAKPKMAKPVMKPKVQDKESDDAEKPKAKKPVVKPKMAKPVMKPKVQASSEEVPKKPSAKKPVVKPRVKPVVKPKAEEEKSAADKPKPKKPVIKPKIQAKKSAEGSEEDKPKPKYKPRPVIRKKPKDDHGDQ
ncbi:4Fe-4S binding protein [Marinoscillum furvescens]|uniref:Formate hydrogenlyase subunit 6/NADH:ubiquinone oxidoreductase subunit I n=1 Tax=Marinoscillum furvescens DSM 4134 TaxID=1122208 RepID=A0A3D9KX12_MARFU|nr:4Fe-4S binding protein [Marinoscillum furvescens]RED91892.1 formate hydrogenlyase subunit 6/NADH:ubiquinone oxidoreductase subunit I [Marinoscillum furvescens DSM 4134]